MKTVSLGARFGGDVVVTSGISAGEQVVVQGQTKLRNGAKVEVLTPQKYSKPSAPPASKPASAAPAAADGKTSSAPVERPTVAAGTLEADPIS